jgi:hypothetical protein
MNFSPAESAKLMKTMGGIARLLREVAADGAASLTPATVRDLKGIARGLAKVRLRRLSAQLLDFARQVASLLRREQGGGDELALLLTDCVQTAKLIKTHLKQAATPPEVLDEVFECRWTEDRLAPVTNRAFVEMAVTSDPLDKASRLDCRYLMDLESGETLVQRTLVGSPQSEETMPPKPRTGVVFVGHGLLFPGFPPREVRIVDSTDSTGALDEGMVRKLLAAGHPSVAALAAAFARAHKNFFAPAVSYGLVSVHALAAIGLDVHVMDPSGDLLRLDRSRTPQGVRCVRLAERARIAGIFGRVHRDAEGRLSLAPLAAVAALKGLELVRL